MKSNNKTLFHPKIFIFFFANNIGLINYLKWFITIQTNCVFQKLNVAEDLKIWMNTATSENGALKRKQKFSVKTICKVSSQETI